MMVFAANVDGTQAFAAVMTALALVLGAYATVISRRTERGTATREETQQLIDQQNVMLERDERRIAALETKNADLENRVEDALSRAISAESRASSAERAHRDCEQRLEAALLEFQGRPSHDPRFQHPDDAD